MWFTNYLRNRMQYVEVNSHKSKLLPSLTGVPQGSILGPLLYIIYVNDFCLQNSVMYADDTTILVSEENVNSLVKETNLQLQEANSWFAQNKLILNNKKSIALRFNLSRKPLDHSLLIKTDNGTLKQENVTKFLGIYISDNCNWSSHIEITCKKIAPICYVINQLRKVIDRPVLLMYYFAHFHSVISYGIIAWGITHDSIRVFRLQKNAIRYIMGVSKRASCREMFKELGVLPLPCILIYHLLLYAKSELSSFNTLNNNHSYNTRNNLTLEVPAHNLVIYEKSPNYLAVTVYNKLPNSYKLLKLSKYKASIKHLLLEKSYYSLKEYLEDKF